MINSNFQGREYKSEVHFLVSTMVSREKEEVPFH